MSRIHLIAVLVAAGAVAAPSIAHGATVYQDGRTPHRLLLQADSGEANLVSAVRRLELDLRDAADTASYHYATTGIRVTVDTEADDGRPGDADRILNDVERVLGSQFDDVLTGSRYPEHLLGLDGDDQTTGGAAEDVLSGGDGNDRIDARDGERDIVDCGAWASDRAAVDADGEASLAGCEEVIS